MIIIGLAGYAGAGKTTIAKILQDKYACEIESFAYSLKHAAMLIYNLEEQQVYGNQTQKEAIDPRWGLTPRFILQRLGTEVARSIHPETWVKSVETRIFSKPSFYRVVIDDVRYQNEVDAIHRWGGQVVLVKRPGLKGYGHSSESPESLLGIDLTYNNDKGEAYLPVDIMLLWEFLQDNRLMNLGG